ncbi:hypothetical protein J1N35_037505 [Gossypium stocksii]|uniref:Uncharacterized protein n=1 Tax=Gossypium stocksii TaxID=47602 RepID=A0A9D3UKB9_9ROSI|nr:hypothetical protein J1N35_037505 [Gossypium stocksii]
MVELSLNFCNYYHSVQDDEDLVHNEEGNGPMMVSVMVTDFKVKRILVDSGSLSWEAYQKIGLKEQVLSKAGPLYRFANHLVEVKGLITLPITLGDGEHTPQSLRSSMIMLM